MAPADYPPGWPACPSCGRPALDGKATCGDVACSPVYCDQGRFNPRCCDVTGEPCRNILCIQHEGCFRAHHQQAAGG
jgi:hypothetical protein